MPGKHQKGDVIVPTFHASGTGRDLYLNPHAGQDKDELKVAIQKPLQYTDIETGDVCTLRWWTRLPASGEHKHRLKRQSAMAKRLSQLPSLDSKKVPKPGRSHSSLGIPGVGLDRYARVAVESFNPWSPHQTNLRNFAVMHGGQRRPDRFSNKAMLPAGGFTDVRM